MYRCFSQMFVVVAECLFSLQCDEEVMYKGEGKGVGKE